MLGLGNKSEAGHFSEMTGIMSDEREVMLKGSGGNPRIGERHGLLAHGASDEFRPLPSKGIVEAQYREVGAEKGHEGLPTR